MADITILPAGSAIPNLTAPHGRIDCSCGGVIMPATDAEHDVAEHILTYGCGCAPAAIAATIPGYHRPGEETAPVAESVEAIVTPAPEATPEPSPEVTPESASEGGQ